MKSRSSSRRESRRERGRLGRAAPIFPHFRRPHTPRAARRGGDGRPPRALERTYMLTTDNQITETSLTRLATMLTQWTCTLHAGTRAPLVGTPPRLTWDPGLSSTVARKLPSYTPLTQLRCRWVQRSIGPHRWLQGSVGPRFHRRPRPGRQPDRPPSQRPWGPGHGSESECEAGAGHDYRPIRVDLHSGTTRLCVYVRRKQTSAKPRRQYSQTAALDRGCW